VVVCFPDGQGSAGMSYQLTSNPEENKSDVLYTIRQL